MGQVIDITGQIFGKLTAIKAIWTVGRAGNNRKKWYCECDCGNYTDANYGDLKHGKVVSCGCHKDAEASKRMTKRHTSGGSTGKNNPNWKGGISEEHNIIRTSARYGIWHDCVFTRDNYVCKICRQTKSGNMVVHHIEPFYKYEDLRMEISNGVTLCEDCHNEFHSIYGKKYFDGADFLEFIYDRG